MSMRHSPSKLHSPFHILGPIVALVACHRRLMIADLCVYTSISNYLTLSTQIPQLISTASQDEKTAERAEGQQEGFWESSTLSDV